MADSPSDEALRDQPDVGRRIAALRKQRGLKLAEVAGAAGVSTSMISQIERGRTLPSVKTLYAVATALGTTVQALFLAEERPPPSPTRQPIEPPTSGSAPATDGSGAARAVRRGELLSQWDKWDGRSPAGPVVRRGEGRFTEIAGGVRWQRLTPYDLGDAAIIATTYEPGSSGADELYRHEGREMHLAIEGRIVVELVFDRYVLAPGDSITFDSSHPHRYSNPFDETARGVTFLLGMEPRTDPTE